MANNLRYLLEHFCLDGQKIDISSQLDEENANNIEKINTQTVPSINARIDDIKNTDIPNINSRIDSIKNTDIPSINQKINTINNTTIPSIQENVNAVNEKADRINESVTKNTRNIGTLSDNVTMQGNAINSIETEKIPSVENNVNELTSKVNTNTDSISELTTKVNTNTDSVSELTSTVSTNTDNINKLTSKVGTNTDSINEITTKVDTNTDNINGLSTKVDTNTDSINTINNTSIPHLQSEIDNLSGGGTGSVGELREKVEKNTSDITELSGKVDTNTANISTLSGKVDSNTSAISTINDTSIPSLQSEIDNLKGSGTGSIGELKTKVEKNTSDITELSGKVDTNTTAISTLSGKVDSHTSAISTINDTSIPSLQSEIDNLKGSGTGSIGELKTKVEKNTSDITELSGKVDTNTTAISTLSGKVDSHTSAISTINDRSIPHLQNEIINVKNWEKILDEYHTPKGMIVNAFVNRQLCLIQLSAILSTPQTIEDGEIKEIIPNYSTFSPPYIVSSSVYVDGYVSSDVHGIFSSHHNNELTLSFKMSSYNFPSVLRASVLYSYYKAEV